MNAPPDMVIRAAIIAANKSPCEKSQRGVVAYRELPFPYVVASGCNAPPPGFACGRNEECRAACSQVCIHAEQAVLSQSFFGPMFVSEATYLVHVKTVDDQLVPSGGPSCWQCSRMFLADTRRMAGIWLFHDVTNKLRMCGPTGWRLYTPREFHEETLRACRLPVIYEPRSKS